ncbi:MAG: hypothetical protein CM1200mP2_23700 [Planctomycetaceae bacterium]|nr:MAG: hypothetical protein CM1200mP2_23700 [Planctomycetaceae bacterium]
MPATVPPTATCNRPGLVAGYLKLGREHGVVYHPGCPVRGLDLTENRVRGVITDHGTISTDVVINAAGPWSYLVAGLVDTPLQTAALGHVYLTTRPDDSHPGGSAQPGHPRPPPEETTRDPNPAA